MSRSRRRPKCPLAAAACFAAACLLALVSCERSGPSAAGPHPEPAVRVAAISPALAEMLREQHLGEAIVARHDYDAFTDPRVPPVGHQEALDYERLLAARPTHVLVQWGRRELPPRLAEIASARGWTVRDFPLTTLDEVRSASAWIREHLHDPAVEAGAIEPAPDPVAALDEALTPPSALAGAGRILLLAATDPPAAIGPGSFHHDVLVRLGGRPAIEEGSPWMLLDAEDVLRLAPDAVVLILPRGPEEPPRPAPAWEELRPRLGRIAGLDIPAVRDRRVVLIDDPDLFLPAPGPLRRFAAALHDAFRDR